MRTRDLKVQKPADCGKWGTTVVLLPEKRRVRPHRLNVKLYKVLSLDGCSASGGSMTWELPKDGKPGPWHAVTGTLRRCTWGLHVTAIPSKWNGGPRDPYHRVFEVEIAGRIVYSPYDDKLCVRAVRLIREVTALGSPARRLQQGSRAGRNRQMRLDRNLRRNPKLRRYLEEV
jgi:hypothetical protein